VDEQLWLACDDPQEMLKFLRGKASDRKLRLFAAACCRGIWHLLPNEPSRRLVEVIERYADCSATDEQLGAAGGLFKSANWDRRSGYNDYVYDYAAGAVVQAARDHRAPHDAWEAAAGASDQASAAAAALAGGTPAWWTPLVQARIDPIDRQVPAEALVGIRGMLAERVTQAARLRDLFGPPPFRPAAIAPSVRTWEDGLIVRLTEAAYQERHLPAGMLDEGRLAVLADALEEAGCTNGDILGHLRGRGPHVRGCWVVDVVRSVD
jgi:hypothetical protein